MNPNKAKMCVAGAVMALVMMTACSKKVDTPAVGTGGEPVETVAMVSSSGRSSHFEAVNRQLELGGTLYGYMDVDGDLLKLAANLQEVVQEIARKQPEVPEIQSLATQDFVELAGILGLADIKAIGMSSVQESDGFFRNRAYLHTGPERRGLLAGLGGRPGAFQYVNLAPANASFYSEAEMDMAAVYRTVREIIARVGGEPVDQNVEAVLKRAGEAVALSLIDLINGLKGHVVMVGRIDEEKTWQVPQLTLPAVSLLLRVDGIAPEVEKALTNSRAFKRTDEGGLRVYALAQRSPIPDLQPVLVAEGRTLYLATNRAFFEECRSGQNTLAANEDFKQALARVGDTGNGLSYVSPRLTGQLRLIETLNPQLPEEPRRVLALVLAHMPETEQALISTRTNLPEGILVKSHLNRSLKQDVLMVAAYNPVTVGLMAAMAIPAFQKVRASSQQKAVLNNLRQFAAAGDQFCLEHGAERATYGDLVGPGRYIRSLNPVAGESYTELVYEMGEPLAVTLGDGRVIRYGQ